jgi:hypothetical protein
MPTSGQTDRTWASGLLSALPLPTSVTIVPFRFFRETSGTSLACQGTDLELRDIRPPCRWPRKQVPMTATLITTGEALDHERNAEFRLSSRQRDVLRTLNTLFDELSPPPIEEEDFLDILESRLETFNVSRVVRG